MNRREVLFGIMLFPLLSFGEISDDELNVDNFRLKLFPKYTLIDLNNTHLKNVDGIVFAFATNKERLFVFYPRTINEKTEIKFLCPREGFKLNKRISANQTNHTFSQNSHNYIIIRNKQILGLSIR